MNQEQIKNILDNAPEGATHYDHLGNDGFVTGYYCIEHGKPECFSVLGAWKLCFSYPEDMLCISDLRAQLEPEPEPEQDWDGEGLPPVGSVVLMSDSRECGGGKPGFKADNPGRKVKIYSHFTDDRGVKLASYVSCDDQPVFGGVACDYAFETPEQKAAREREEAAYDLYCYWCDVMLFNADSIEVWREDEKRCNAWLNIADKTDYRKGPTND